jgi:Putative transcriptional regulator
VQSGHASASDFLTFIGYCGWDAGQLVEELDKESWYMVAADSTTLLEELKKNNESDEILDAGLDSWRLLMSMIGKQKRFLMKKTIVLRISC